jgi:RNA polymerase sigma-70 factor (ECF subfamily)
MVRQFLHRLGLTHAEADDATQEILMVAHRALRDGTYDPARGRFRRWLYGVARRRALSAFRDRRRPTRMQLEGFGDPLDRLPDDQAARRAAELWQQEWRFALLEEGLRYAEVRVGEKVFRAFTLYVHEKKPVQEVAEMLGIAPASVYVYKSRVLDAVREWTRQFEESA